jgi:hypothetical protein
LIQSLIVEIAHAVGRRKDVGVTLRCKKSEPCDLIISDLEELQLRTGSGVLLDLALACPHQQLSCEESRRRSLHMSSSGNTGNQVESSLPLARRREARHLGQAAGEW